MVFVRSSLRIELQPSCRHQLEWIYIYILKSHPLDINVHLINLMNPIKVCSIIYMSHIYHQHVMYTLVSKNWVKQTSLQIVFIMLQQNQIQYILCTYILSLYFLSIVIGLFATKHHVVIFPLESLLCVQNLNCHHQPQALKFQPHML